MRLCALHYSCGLSPLGGPVVAADRADGRRTAPLTPPGSTGPSDAHLNQQHFSRPCPRGRRRPPFPSPPLVVSTSQPLSALKRIMDVVVYQVCCRGTRSPHRGTWVGLLHVLLMVFARFGHTQAFCPPTTYSSPPAHSASSSPSGLSTEVQLLGSGFDPRSDLAHPMNICSSACQCRTTGIVCSMPCSMDHVPPNPTPNNTVLNM